MPIQGSNFDFIRQLIRNRTGVVLSEDKMYLVESRLAFLVRETGTNSLDGLVTHLRQQKSNCLTQLIIEAMMTNETFFFRDVHPFEALKIFVLPELLQKRKLEGRLNIWCGACSSGQEPYSIAILLQENFPQLSSWQVKLIASDISTSMLKKSMAGSYSQHEVNRGLSAGLRQKYFHPSGNQWLIKEEIRRMVEFRQMNLTETFSSMPQIDVIFLRNVLIYFDIEMKRKILAGVRKVLRDDGYLFLGGGETTVNLDDSFIPVQLDKAVCYRLRR
ncbi:MAG TPA: chemotaxis protein CheR [Cyanobacteria bacterium UBA11149]|nr:chemotaxis protein CheR [Cyanobacteria bacterium UBA11367]HBE57332.1 chemotaxis protein CheR [Cyanobacteria bacterium UBA11366]HBK64437.1 chemotaxis protein CheR [Cyanobacteria bacterium UBA11166]HBR72327.1 chemotaxis protein CheR [Cyanobacteria bacterium UBA11159]HBS70417.1 chemotaxis protein CheR [Cyanobacteria bacterium UBA11153]HBW89361.1 chemotaxis protein CheR [Cyanobacteria bacterium UBA11149]HCA97653.1 chemotaxis protein CheR [Cyanobacteria bacterium UBA9226]